MSGNRETQVRPSSWLCSNFNAGIPIKKRKYFVRSVSPPAEEASSILSEIGCQLNEQGGSNVRSVSCSLDENEKIEKTLPEEKRWSCVTAVATDRKIIDQPSLSTEEQHSLFQSDFIGNVRKIEKPGDIKAPHTALSPQKEEMKLADTENTVRGLVDQRKIKTEEMNLPVSSISFSDVEKREQPVRSFGSSIVSSSVQSFSLVSLAECSGVAVSSDKTGMIIDRTLLTMNGMIDETCDRKNVGGGCQAEVSSGSGTAKLSLGCKAGNNIHHGEKEESLALNLSLSKGVCPPHNNDEIPVSTNAGRCNGINRSNWDLNTTMDAWEDARDSANVDKANFAFLSSKSSLCDVKASSAHDNTIISNSVSEEQENRNVGFRSDVVTSMQSNHQGNSRCSLSLGLNSYPPAEKSLLSARTTQTGSAYTSFSMPMMTAMNVNPATLSIVKSEHLEEVVRKETEKAKICPVQLSSSRVKQELVEKCSQITNFSSCFLNSMDPTPKKAEPNNCIQSEAVNREDETWSHPDMPLTKPNEMCDLPTCSTSNQKDIQMSYSIGYERIPVFLAGMTVNTDDLNYSERVLHENSARSSSEAHGILHKTLKHSETYMNSTCFGQGDNNCNVSGVTVTSLTEDKTVDDQKTCSLKEPPLNSRGTDESSLSDEEKINLSSDMLEEDLYGSDFESDGHDLSKVKRKKQNSRNNEDHNVQGSAAAVSEDYSPGKKSKLERAKCIGSETKNGEIAVVFHGSFQNSSRVDERGSEFNGLGKTGNEHIKECSGTSLDTKHKKYADDEPYLMELVEMPSHEDGIKRLIPELQRRALDGSGETEGIQDAEHSSCLVNHASEGVSGASTVSSVNIQNPEIFDKSSTASFGADISTGDPPKEFSGGGTHSRIINLARVSDKSPAKPLDASGSFGPSRAERERLSDLPLESRKFLSRGRDEAFSDISYKFSRGRYHDHFENQRLNFMPDRRRFSDRTESIRRGRDSENFEFNNYGNTCEDGAFFSSFRRGRRSWNDQATFFPHSFSRRRSPGNSFTHRGPRNSEDASSFHELRDGEKYSRGLPHNNMDPMTRPQHPYEDFNGHFVRGQRNFSTNHKRAFPQFRSRSPNGSRARSPGSCSSFRNRSPEGFSGHPDLPRRRSSPSYRMERIRSPDPSGFPRDMTVRRHGSPPYSLRSSNVFRDVDSGRGRGYRRSGPSFRNQPDRVFRNHGKFNILNSRERVEYGDGIFEGRSHSDRFDEFGVNVNVERRTFEDRHDGVRPFRPSFNTDDCAPTNIENDPGSMRFGQEDATETEEHGNLKEFDRQS